MRKIIFLVFTIVFFSSIMHAKEFKVNEYMNDIYFAKSTVG